MIAILTLFALFVGVFSQGADTPNCSVTLLLFDSGGDGWSDNYVIIQSGINVIKPTPLDTQAYWNDSLGASMQLGAQTAFQFNVPSGSSLSVTYVYSLNAYPSENSWKVQLSTIVDAFGPVILGKSAPKDVDGATYGSTTQVPYMAPIGAVICGPIPPPVTAVTAAPGSKINTVQISWPAIVTAAGSSALAVQYSVVYRNATAAADAPWLSLGATSSAGLEAAFASSASYIFGVSAMNVFGVSAITTSCPYTMDIFDTCDIRLDLSDSYGDGWGADAAVFVLLDGIRILNAQFVCPTSSGCTKLSYILSIPDDGVAHNISAHFLPPKAKVGECSFSFSTTNDSKLFDSGLDPVNGPDYFDAFFQYTCPFHIRPYPCDVCCLGAGRCGYLSKPEGSCCPAGSQCCAPDKKNKAGNYACCTGSDRCLANATSGLQECATPVVTCPTSTPSVDSSCYGQLTCGYSPFCCCPDEPNSVDKNCGNTLIYTCTGAIGSKWVAQNKTLQCSVDPAFTCPSACPKQEPTNLMPCTGSKTCNFGTTCCCPEEKKPENQLCSSSSQYSCTGQVGSIWNQIIVTPPACPDTCYSKVSHPGQCPAANTSCVAGDLKSCDSDKVCGAKQKCCDNGCGNTCLDACDCSATPKCLSWQKVVFQPGGACCGGINVCQDDPTSTSCPTTPTQFGPCVANSGVCGNGTQTRVVYTRDPEKDCVVTSENQTCSIPCPVDCVGEWGPWGTCSASCGIGYQTQTYAVKTPAANNGKPCLVTDKTVSDPRQCSGLPACDVTCQFAMDYFDLYCDGWDPTMVLEVYVAGVKVTNVTIPPDAKLKSCQGPRYIIKALRGSEIMIKYIQGQEGYPMEASYTIAKYVPSATGGSAITPCEIKSPPKLDNTQPPDLVRKLTSNCITCDKATPSYCNQTLNRAPCESMLDVDNLCGGCLPGYTNTSTDRSQACVDIDECAGFTTNPCAYANATCQNLPGSYTCLCPAGGVFSRGYCTVPGQCPTVRLRKEWNDLSPVEKDQYIRAVGALNKAGKFAIFWQRHSRSPGFPYAHGTASFLPWHRQFIMDWENAIRSLGGEFACFCQPYWDFTAVKLSGDYTSLQNNFMTNRKENGLFVGMGAFTNFTAVCKDPNHPFASITTGPNGCIGRGKWSIPNFFGPADMWNLMKTKTYKDFHLGLEGCHGAIHVWIGADMGGAASPADPMFFLLHTYIDAVWATWASCNGWTDPDTVPQASKWDSDFVYNGVVKGFNDPMADCTGNVSPRDMWNPWRAHKVLYSDSWVKRSLASSSTGCPKPLSFLLSPDTAGPISPPPALLEEEGEREVLLSDILSGRHKETFLEQSYGGKKSKKKTQNSHFRKQSTLVSSATSDNPDSGYVPANKSGEIFSDISDAWKATACAGNFSEAIDDAVATGCELNPKFPISSMLSQEYIDMMPDMDIVCAAGWCNHPCTKLAKRDLKDDEEAKKKKKKGEVKHRIDVRIKGGIIPTYREAAGDATVVTHAPAAPAPVYSTSAGKDNSNNGPAKNTDAKASESNGAKKKKGSKLLKGERVESDGILSP